jgi:glycosyltransferase involved in cell wall biosynthesis
VPAAAVVIPTRNRRPRLQRAIRSVAAQAASDWELVIVDDASADDTGEFLRSLSDGRIKVERLAEHGERSRARNRGLERVTAPAVLFLDDDDELLPEALGLLGAALDRHPGACAAAGACLHEVDGGRQRPWFPGQPALIDVRLELVAGWVALGGQSLMRTALVREVGAWREGLSVAEDQELWLRLCGHGPLALVPQPVLIHRPHGLQGDAPDFREVERAVVAEHLRARSGRDPRGRRAAVAREHLRNADVAFKLGEYRPALGATLRGIAAAPFLLRSPLVGRGIARGLINALIASLLPGSAADALRAARQRRRRRPSPPAGDRAA